MNYKYQRRQIFGKRLKVPKHILDKVYNCTLSFNEFIEYQLDDKIPTSCIVESDRKIVERFGIEKCKELDWELINERIYDSNINFRDILMSIDSQTKDINQALYEQVKDQISPSNYPPKMAEIYSDRLFEISPIENNAQVEYLKRRFNYGEVSLKEIVNNWVLFKDKDLSYCLQNDKDNNFNINNDQLKDFMNKFGNILILILDNTNIDQFIYEFYSSKSELEKQEYIKKFTDNILEKTITKGSNNVNIKLYNHEYRELFKYSSLEEYLKKIYNGDLVKKFIKELQELPQDYLFNIPIPFSELLSHDVLYFIGIYGLKNVVDFDNEWTFFH